MRFMMIVKSNKDCEAGKLPSEELLAAMGEYNKELMKAGVLVDLSGGKTTVTDGPFAETKELIGGYWIIDVKSKAEAIEWAKRVPCPHGEGQEGEIEIRQFYEFTDFLSGKAIEEARELERELAGSKK
jgi:hypothetical protein